MKHLQLGSIKLLLLILILSFGIASKAQYTRLSLDLNAGVPYGLTSIPTTITTYGGIGLKYNISATFAAQISFNYGNLSGTQTASSILPYENTNSYITDFNNSFYSYTLKGSINLEKLFKLRRYIHRLNPYLTGGLGWTVINDKTDYISGAYTTYTNIKIYTACVGLQFKYYINPILDFNFGTEFNTTQSYYIDGAPSDKKYDSYLLNYVGVTVKFGSRKDKQFIEWNNVILKDRMYIPDIEKHIGQPLDEAGNYFVFPKDSINKLITQNIEIKKKSDDLELKSAVLAKKDSTQQIQIDSMQKQLINVRASIDTIKAQKVIAQSSDQPNQQPNDKNITPANNNVSGNESSEISKLKNENNQLKNKINDLQQQIDQLKHSPNKGGSNPSFNNKQNDNSQVNKTASNEGLNKINDVVAPTYKYNVIAGAYIGEKYAYIFRDKLRAKGYEAAVFKSNTNSRILRVCVLTTENKSEAINMMKKVRSEIDPGSWVHVFPIK